MADSIDSIIGSADWYKTQQMTAASQRNNTVSEAALGMKDFLLLLVAQLQNQDMMNPMDNTEFIAQMATFSQLTAVNNMVDQSITSYAVSLLGKEVTAAVLDSTGKLETIEGVVTGISLFENEPRIYIGDRSFSLQSVMSVGKLPNVSKPDESETINMLGSYDTEDALYEANLTGNVGDAYRIGDEIWAWSSTTNSWVVSRSILGAFDNREEFDAAWNPNAGSYLIGKDIFEWSEASESWIKSESILGSYDTYKALVTANQKGGVGDAYIIGDNEIWKWSSSTKGWIKTATIIGEYATDVALRTARPMGIASEAYRVAGDIWMWSVTSKSWFNAGKG